MSNFQQHLLYLQTMLELFFTLCVKNRTLHFLIH